MHRRRASDASLSNSIGATSDADDGEKKKKKRNIFKNLIPKRRKPKLSSLDDAENVSGASWFPNPIITGEAEESNNIVHAEITERHSDEQPLPHSVGSSTSNPQKPIPPPRRRKQSPEKLPEKLPVLEGSSLDETLSPVGPLQCAKPAIHSRTSSHSSGFEEGSSSLTETSDASTWKDLIPRITDRVEGLRWMGESLGVRTSSANHVEREMESSDDAPLKTGKSDSSTTCDEDIQVFSPEISLSVEEVLGEYFASKGNLLASFTHPEEHALAPHASAVTKLDPDARLFSSNDRSDSRDSSGLISRENSNARTTPTHITIGHEPKISERETRQLSRNTDHEAFSETLEPALDCDLDIRSSFNKSDRNNNRFLRGGDKTKYESTLRSHVSNDSSSCNGVSKDIEERSMETEIHKREMCNQVNDETAEVPDSEELLECAVYNESMNIRSPQTPFVEETSDIRLSTMSSSPNQRKYSCSSSTSSASDKDSPIPLISDKSMTGQGNLMDEKTVTSAKDSTVSRNPRSRSEILHSSRSQSFQSPRRTSNSSSNESVAPRSSQTEPEIRGAPGRRKNVSFIVNDEGFGRYVSRPHGIESKMVLPYTERQKLSDFGGKSDSVTPIGKTWMERHFPPPKKPIPGTNRQLETEDRFDERQSSLSKNHQSVTRSTAVIRRHSDRRDTSEVSGTFGSNHNVSRIATKNTVAERSAYHDLLDTRLMEHQLEGIPSSAYNYLETRSVGNIGTPYRDKYKSVARVSTRPRDLSDRNSVSSDIRPSYEKRQDSPAAKVSNRPRGVDSDSSQDLNSATKDSTERLSGPQPLHRRIPEGRYQPETSQRDVETDLAKKFEAFNVRLAAMASAAAAKRSPRSTCSDMGRPFGSFQKGKWVSSDCVLEEGVYDETRAASVFDDDNKSLPGFRETDRVNYQKEDLGPCTSNGIVRSRSEADDDMKARYHSLLESRSRLASADTTFGDEESPKENQLRTSRSTISTEQDQRLCSSFADLNHENRGDEFVSRTPDSHRGSYTSLETSNTHRPGFGRGLYRSHSKGEYDQLDPKPKKTLREQGEELQRQFSSWHRLLVSEKSRSFFDHSENQEENSKQSGSALLSRSFQDYTPLAAVSESERLQNQSGERTPVRMGTKPIVRRPMSERKFQDTSSDPTKTLPWETSDDSPQMDGKELASVGSLDKRLVGRPLRRSMSCAQPQRDLFPRTAMAKFNDDGTPKSILKKSNALRSQSANDKAEEEEDYDDDYGLKGSENDLCDKSVNGTDDTVSKLLHSSPLPPLPSSAPPDLPPHRQTTLPSPIPSYSPSPQSPNPPASFPPSFPSSYPPSSPSQTRTPSSFPPPLPPFSPSRLPSSFLPPSPPRRVSSFFYQTLPPSPQQTTSKSPSPLPPPLPSSSPPPLPYRSVTSDVSPSTVSPGSDFSSSSWSPDSGSSKFLGLQNLQKRSAILNKRSRSDLGATASILAALSQH